MLWDNHFLCKMIAEDLLYLLRNPKRMYDAMKLRKLIMCTGNLLDSCKDNSDLFITDTETIDGFFTTVGYGNQISGNAKSPDIENIISTIESNYSDRNFEKVDKPIKNPKSTRYKMYHKMIRKMHSIANQPFDDGSSSYIMADLLYTAK